MKNNNQKLPIFKKEKIEDYISNKEFISSHGLMDILRSPFHYKKGLKIKPEPTKALIIGAAFHCLLLEPKEFDKQYEVFTKPYPDHSMNKLQNKNALEDLEESNPDKVILKKEDFNEISNILNEARNNKRIRELLELKGVIEQSIYFEDKEFKVKAKIRPDKYCTSGILIDVKTTIDASPEGFSRQCMNFNYDMQLAFYPDKLREIYGKEFKFIFIIAVENKYPYACQVYNCVELGFIDVGRKKYKKAMADYVECLKTDKWKGYEKYATNPYGIIDLKLPDWHLRSQYGNPEII